MTVLVVRTVRDRQVVGEGRETGDVNNIIFRFVLPVINTIIVCKHSTLLHDTLHTPHSSARAQQTEEIFFPLKYFLLSTLYL